MSGCETILAVSVKIVAAMTGLAAVALLLLLTGVVDRRRRLPDARLAEDAQRWRALRDGRLTGLEAEMLARRAND